MTKVLSGKELDQAAIDAAIARAPFNAHEKSSVAIHRNVMALMYKDGYKASEAAHADYMALEEELAALRVRVGELVEADRAFDAAQMAFVLPKHGITVDDASDACEKAIERRTKAMEIFA